MIIEIPKTTYNFDNSNKSMTKSLSPAQSFQKENKFLSYALMAAPPYRRMSAIPDKMSSDEIVYSLGMASLGLVNFPQDLRDIKEALKQVFLNLQGQKYKGVYDFKNYQHDFSLCHGTLLEKFIDAKKMRNLNLAQKIQKLDTTLLHTSFGRMVLDLFGVSETKTEVFKQLNKNTNIWEAVKDVNGNIKYAHGFSGNKFGVLTAHVLARTIIPELMVFSIVELPLIYRASQKGQSLKEKAKNTLKQTAKSAITVASLFLGFGYLGAIGSKYFKVFGSLAGMGLGAIIGTKVSQKINQYIG